MERVFIICLIDFKHTSAANVRGAFHFGYSGGKSMERTFPPEMFRKKNKVIQKLWYFSQSLVVFTGIIGKSLYQFPRPTSAVLGNIYTRFSPTKILVSNCTTQAFTEQKSTHNRQPSIETGIISRHYSRFHHC